MFLLKYNQYKLIKNNCIKLFYFFLLIAIIMLNLNIFAKKIRIKRSMTRRVITKGDYYMNPKLLKDNIKLKIDIPIENRREVSSLLTNLLANEYTLTIKTQKYHWNLYGLHFNSLHKFLDEQYKQQQEYINLIAERIRALGFNTIGTLKEFIENSDIKEQPGIIPNDLGMIKQLLDDHELIIRQMRNIIYQASKLHDEGTSNFLADLIIKHEKTAWMLRSFLIKKESNLDLGPKEIEKLDQE